MVLWSSCIKVYKSKAFLRIFVYIKPVVHIRTGQYLSQNKSDIINHRNNSKRKIIIVGMRITFLEWMKCINITKTHIWVFSRKMKKIYWVKAVINYAMLLDKIFTTYHKKYQDRNQRNLWDLWESNVTYMVVSWRRSATCVEYKGE